MAVILIRKADKAAPGKTARAVAANQKAADEVPLDSGDWKVEGVPGLYLRARKRTKSYFIFRRIRGRLLKESLGQLSMKQARAEAMKTWAALKPKPARHEAVTLAAAIEAYLSEKQLAEKTLTLYRYNADRYFGAWWLKRTLEEVGNDRAGVRRLQAEIRKKHGRATANQIVRLLSAVYRWQRKIDPLLPEPPTTAVEVDKIPARDWALSADELRAWWRHEKKGPDGKKIPKGVSTLGPIKRAWWLTALFTGARKGSIEALKWADIDFDKKVIRFRVTKGNRPYMIPMADKLLALLKDYRDNGEVPPSDWVFPSNVNDGAHIVGVKNDKEGVPPAHRLRHTYRTALAEIGATPDQARMLMGHATGSDVSTNYITAPLVVESLRPVTNAVSEHYIKALGW